MLIVFNVSVLTSLTNEKNKEVDLKVLNASHIFVILHIFGSYAKAHKICT